MPKEELQPSGIPLSRALIIRPGIANDDLREAVDAISRVHGDGDLPEVPVVLTGRIVGPAGNADGRIVFQSSVEGPPEPNWILVRSGARHRHFALVHEVGHLIDLFGLPGRDFASILPEVTELDEWRQAVVASRAVATLDDRLRLATADMTGRLSSMLSFDELWARSYAQFVALRSGSVTLLRALDVLRTPRIGEVYYPLHWADDDFGPVDRAMQTLFRGLGWISGKSGH